MRFRSISVIVCVCMLSAALMPAMAICQDAASTDDSDQKRAPKSSTAPERAELEQLILRVEAQRAPIDKIFASSKDTDTLLDAVAVIFEQREYVGSTYAYSKLIDLFDESDLSPLLRAYRRTKSVEARIWFASTADYCDNQVLLKKLSQEVETLKGELRARAAIAVAFRLGDPSMVPHLIESLSSKIDLWIDYPVKAGPSAAYLLTELTNQFFGDYPDNLRNYSCWVMPPPVVPYPVPIASRDYIVTSAESQRDWRRWWQANKSRSQEEWVLAGIKRDVSLFRSGAGPEQSDKLVGRLERFLGVELQFGYKPRQGLEKAWESAQRHYRIPSRITK